MRIYRDPVTGELGDPPAEAPDQISLPPADALSTSSEGLVETRALCQMAASWSICKGAFAVRSLLRRMPRARSRFNTCPVDRAAASDSNFWFKSDTPARGRAFSLPLG